MAREMGRSEGAIKQLQWRALKSLRELAGEANG
jgi:DNA-directed RNA polymerase specialized sigma24 family protein